MKRMSVCVLCAQCPCGSAGRQHFPIVAPLFHVHEAGLDVNVGDKLVVPVPQQTGLPRSVQVKILGARLSLSHGPPGGGGSAEPCWSPHLGQVMQVLIK